jgi:hypothetical protein
MILTKGTQLYILDPRTPPFGTAITKLDCPKSITGLGLSTPQINTTCLDSTAEEFVPGMPSPGAATVGLDFDTAKASHMLIEDLNEAQVVAQFAIGLADGVDIAPTGVDSDGDLVLPDTRSWIVFDGYIADLPLDFALNSTVQSNFTIQQSGRRRILPKNVS